MPLNRKTPVTISVPNVPKTPYDLSNSGTFTEGDFQIGRQGLRISSTPSELAAAEGREPGKEPTAATTTTNRVVGFKLEDATDGGEHSGGSEGGVGAQVGSSSRSSSGRGAPAASGAGDGYAGETGDSEDRTGDETTSTSRGSDAASGMFDIALDELEVLGIVGRGSSGSVQRAVHAPTGNMLAIKVVQMNVQADVRKNIIQELRTLHQSSCQHIVPYHGAFFSDGSISIILDYMDGGSLADVTQALGTIPEAHLAGFSKQILRGLTYLHKEIHIIHRDIKPSNLLVNCKGEVKISDFGVSGQLANSVTKCNSWVGTVTYMSPERISGKPYSFDSDIWSFGLSLVECAIGRFPYPPPDVPAKQCAPLGFWDLLDFIVEEDPPRLPKGDEFPTFSKQFEDFVEQCLRKEPKDRVTATALLAHEWIGMYDEEDLKLAELVKKSADLRATAANAK